MLFLSFRSGFLNRWSNLLFALAQSLQLIETRSTLQDMLEEYREFRIPRMKCESREGIVNGTPDALGIWKIPVLSLSKTLSAND